MTLLHFKSLIFRWTGTYLAHREENDYVNSEEYRRECTRIMADPDHNVGPENCHDLLIGLWQARHGFTSKFRKHNLKRNSG